MASSHVVSLHEQDEPVTGTMRAVVLDAPRATRRADAPGAARPHTSAGLGPDPGRAFDLDRSELHTRVGLADGVTFPRVPGIEATGVVALCPGGEFRGRPAGGGHDGRDGTTFDGGYAQYTCVPAGQVIPFRSGCGPTWADMFSSDTDWMTRDEIVSTTYQVGGLLNDLKHETGLIDDHTHDTIARRSAPPSVSSPRSRR